MNNQFTVKELHEGKIEFIPEKGGIYYFILPNGFEIEVLEETEGLKQYRKWDKKSKGYVMRDSRYKVENLEKRIAQYRLDDNNVVYIGSAVNLRERIQAFLDFRFDNVQGFHYHSGGRSIWQIKNNKDLLVSWRVVDIPEGCEKKEYVQQIERHEIDAHIDRYGCLPYANRRR